MKRKLSDRVIGLKPSATLAIAAKANELKAKGENVIGFGVGEPDFDTPANIKESGIKSIQAGKTKYTDVGGIKELKAAVIEKFKRDNDITYKASEIIVSCGGKHSLYNLCMAFFEPGDEVLVPAPYWVSYPPMVELADATPVIIPTGKDKDFKIDPDDLARFTTPKTKALILNYPSNPSGVSYTRDELSDIAEFCIKNSIYVVSDEIYEKLIYDGFKHTSIASIGDDIRQLTIIVNGVSKTYAMTGWRIGYAAGPEALISAMTKIQSQSTTNASSVAQWAAVEALIGPQDEVERMRREFEKRRKLIVDGLNAVPGVTCRNPEGAFYAFPDVSRIYGKSYAGAKITGSIDFAAFLLSEAKVALVPGVEFGDDNCVRLSYAASEAEITEGVRRIGDAVKKLG
jgi:aspartate aminotransferase